MAVELLQYKIELDATEARNAAAVLNHDLDTQQQIAKQVGEEFDKATKRIDAGFKAAEKSVEDFEKAQTKAQQTAQREAEKTTGVLTKLAGVIGTGAFLAAIKSAADYADRLGELSQQTGFGVVALQKFDAAARVNGSSLEALSTSFGTFQDRLSGGDKSVVSAVGKLGLSLDSLKKLSPDEQMRALAEAVSGIADPTEKANIATDLFGRSGRALIPTLAEIAKNYGALPAMSEDVVNATGSLADQWDSLTHTGQVLMVQALAPLVKAFGDNQSAILNLTNVMPALQQGFETYVVLSALQAAKALVDFGIKIGDLEAYIPGLSTVLGTTSGNMQKMREDSQYLSDTIKGMQQPTQQATADTQKHGLALVGTAAAVKNMTEILQGAKDQVAALTSEERAQIDAGIRMHDSVKNITAALNAQYPELHLTEAAVREYESGLKDAAKAAKEAAKAAKEDGSQAIEAFLKSLYKLDKEIQTAIDNGTTWPAIIAKWGPQLFKANQEAVALGVSISDLGDDFVTATQKATQAHWDDIVAKQAAGIHTEAEKIYKDQADLLKKSVDERNDTIAAGNETSLGLAKQLKDERAKLTLNETDYQISQADRWMADEKEKLNVRADTYAENVQSIEQVHALMVANIIKASDPMFQMWNHVKDLLRGLRDDVNNNFAQMLTGAESFGEGFTNIWHALRDTATSILAEILAYYEKVFLVRMLTGMSGGGAGWTQALAGAALSGAGGSGGGVGGAGLAQTGIGLATTGTGGAGIGGASAIGLGTAAAYGGSSIAGGVVGYTVGRATGSAAKGALAGAGAGALYGSVVPGGGTAVGAIVGAIAGAYGAHKANEAARNEMVAIRDQIKEQFGNLDAARQAAQAVGVDLDKAFANIGRGVDGVKEFNAVIADFEKKFGDLDGALKHYGLTLDQVREMSKSASDQIKDGAKTLDDYYAALTGAGMDPSAALKTMAGDFNTLLAQAIDTGAKLPATMEPFLQKMNEMGLITDANRDKLLGLSSSSTVDMAAMTDVAKRYGLSLESLGDKFNAAKLTDDARQVAKDFKILQDGGADIGAVLEGMAPKFQDLVSQSRKFGTALPEDLKDPIAYLIQTGQLVDENGVKLTDLSQIKFGASMADQFKPVTDAIHELIDVLSGKKPGADSLPGALESGIGQMQGIARGADITIPVGFHYETFDPPVPGAAGAMRGGYVTDSGVQYLATGGMARVLGFRPRGSDTVPAMLTPGEGVLSRRGMAALGALNHGETGGSVVIQKGAINVYAADDPEATAEAVVRKIAERRKLGRRVA